MARARNIKPGFYKNEDLAECSIWARFIFPGLWMLADREGRLEDRPKRIKGELLPFDSQDVDPLLNELQALGFLVRYRSEDGAFIQISKFSTHQNPHYSEKASVIKPPELPESTPHQGGNKPGTLRENSEKTPPIKRGSQPPDSLIPDSLIPDSPNPLVVAASKASPTRVASAPTTQGAVAAALRQMGVDIHAQHPTLQQWLDDGITLDKLVTAVKVAKGRDSCPTRLKAAYLDQMVRDPANFKPGKFDPVAYVVRTA